MTETERLLLDIEHERKLWVRASQAVWDQRMRDMRDLNESCGIEEES